HFRQRNVENYDIGFTLTEPFYCLDSAGILNDIVLVLQNRSYNETVIRIVVNDGNFAHVIKIIPREFGVFVRCTGFPLPPLFYPALALRKSTYQPAILLITSPVMIGHSMPVFFNASMATRQSKRGSPCRYW